MLHILLAFLNNISKLDNFSEISESDNNEDTFLDHDVNKSSLIDSQDKDSNIKTVNLELVSNNNLKKSLRKKPRSLSYAFYD